MKIEIVYKNSKGEVVDKRDLPKNVRVSSTPRIKTLVKDKYGFEYKSTRSKNSEVKKYFIEPMINQNKFNYSEDENFIKAENDKYSITFNKKTQNAEISKIIPPSLFKGYVEGKTARLKTISLDIDDIQAIKDDQELLNILVETN